MPASSRSAMPRSSASAPIPPGCSPNSAGASRSPGLIGRRRSPPACVGYATSFIIARFRHLALIMLTLGFGLLLEELANSASWLTGGIDGLQGIDIWPLARPFQVRSLRLHRLRLFARRAVRAVPVRAAADPFAVRPGAARHPRELCAHAGDRRAEPRAYPHHLHHLRGDGRRRRRAASRRPRQTRVARFARLRALRRRAGHAGAGRRRHGSMAG